MPGVRLKLINITVWETIGGIDLDPWDIILEMVLETPGSTNCEIEKLSFSKCRGYGASK